MFNQLRSGFPALLLLGLMVGCASNTPYTPASGPAETIDTSSFAPKVESFVVIMDISSSMGEDYQERVKSHIAKDTVASFNNTVPPMNFGAGLVTFGKNTGWCLGNGVATAVYGLEPHSQSGFASALGSLGCDGGTTPMPDGIDAATQMLANESGPLAVILVSDFKWINDSKVRESVSQLKAAHSKNLCFHTIKVGDETRNDGLISELTDMAGCDSAVNAGDLASAGAMSSFVTDVLLAPLQYEKHTVSAKALFDFDKSDLKPQGEAELRNLAAFISSKESLVKDIDIIGHTDSRGTEEYNQALSERRAMAVKTFLVSAGIDSSIIDVRGAGEMEPVASNDSDDGRAMNRRVEVHVGATRPLQD
jgi:OOP family OmpA-OmpF porin